MSFDLICHAVTHHVPPYIKCSLSQDTDEIVFVAKETLEGHQRAIMGNMTVEEIYRDRKTVCAELNCWSLHGSILNPYFSIPQFSTRVFEVASTDLVNMGVMIISYTIKDITDEVGYLAVSVDFEFSNDVHSEEIIY